MELVFGLKNLQGGPNRKNEESPLGRCGIRMISRLRFLQRPSVQRIGSLQVSDLTYVATKFIFYRDNFLRPNETSLQFS